MKRIFIGLIFLLPGCASEQAEQQNKISADRSHVRENLGSEVSLSSDQQKLDGLRGDIPDEKRRDNDELAFFLNQMREVKEEPARIRERFQALVQKKRSRFNDKADKLRKQYEKDEARRRDDFNASQSERRGAFKKQKQPSDKTREFYSQLEKDRLDFYSKERDRRKDFDDEIHEQTKSFNDYMHERTDEFTEQIKIYSRRYDEAKKHKAPEEEPHLPEPSPAS